MKTRIAARMAAGLLAGLCAQGSSSGAAESAGNAAAPAGAAARAAQLAIARLPDWSGAWFRPAFGPPAPGEQPRANVSRPVWTAAWEPRAKAASDDLTIHNNAVSCLPDGVPNIMSAPYSFEFLFTPGRVTIIAESGFVRRVFTDGRNHPEDPDPTFAGHSIGHWEGGTLVIDTVGITDAAEIARGVHGSGQVHVVERIHLTSPGHLQLQGEVTDPQALAQPYRYTLDYERTPVGMIEYVCEQNNKGNNEFPASGSGTGAPR